MTAVSITSGFGTALATTVLTDTASETELTFNTAVSEQIDLLLDVTINAGTPIITLEVYDDVEGWALYPFGGPETSASKYAPTANATACWTVFGNDRKEQSFRLRASDASEAATLKVQAARKSTGIPFVYSA